MNVQEVLSDGCSLFPDLWIRECCVAHDIALASGIEDLTADMEFMKCVVEESQWLGPFAWALAGLIVGGMALGRPLYRRWKEAKESGKIKEVDQERLNG